MKIIKSILIIALFFGLWIVFCWPINISDNLQAKRFEFNAWIYKDDIITKCEDIQCVFEKVTENYKFNDTNMNDRLKLLTKNPNEVVLYGGVCRDYAVTYCAALWDLEDTTCYIHVENNHAFNVVWQGNQYCVIDQKDMICSEFKI